MSSDGALDEFGLPMAWRREAEYGFPPDGSAWSVFADWAARRGDRSFPAPPRLVLDFLLDHPVEGPALYEVWVAIERRHEAVYWHTDADPVALLRLGGVRVEDDGTVVIPDRLLEPWPD